MAYGSATGVAAFASTWTNAGVFDTTTSPTLATVTTWLDQVSELMNISLSQQGFGIPVTQEDAKKALDLKVNILVADLVKLQHNKGRLFSDRIRESGEDPFTIIERELLTWVTKRINALEAYGIPRDIDYESNQAYSVPMGRQL